LQEIQLQFSSQITDVLRMDLARGLICRWFVLVLTMMLVGGLHPLAANAQVVTTVAGDGTYGFADGTGTAAQFKYPAGVAVQGDSLFVADGSNDRIRMIILSTREVTTVAGGTEGFLDGTGTAARFDHPRGVAVQGDSLFVADRDNNRIRKIILSTQEVTTVAGDGTEGFLDGTGTAARFDDPRGVAVQGDILFVADRDNNRIRKIILSTQEVTTVAGGTKGFLDGTGTTARFNYPYGVAVQGGSLFVADAYNNRIRKIILSTQEVTTVAGGTEGFLDGTGTAARLDRPRGLLVRGDILFVADTDNYRIRKIVLKPIIVTSSLLTFGNVPLADGVTTVTDTIKIKNTGAQPLTVSAVNVSGLDAASYAVVSPASFTVSGGDSANLAVAFSPSAPGRSDASLVLTHNDVDAGSQTTIALHANVYERIPGYVIAWGTNNWGATVVPADLTGVIAIESGYVHGLALKLDGTVVGWGAVPNDWDSGQADIPVGLTDVVTIAGGFFHSLALKADGTVVAWGDNSDGQTDVPVDLINPVAIAGGLDYSLALRSDGTVVAWGDGMGATNVPAYLTDVIAISSFVEHVLALKSDGTVVAWGSNDYGELDVPVDLTDVIAVSAGYEHSLALKSDGTVEAWGRNDYGQTTVPGDLTDVIAVGGGNSHSLALKSDGTVVSWGDSSYGQAVVPADWTYGLAISVGFHHNLALIDPRPTIATSSLFTFGDVPLANGVASVTDTIKIKNKGTLPLTVSAVNVSGVDGGSYSVVSPTSFTVSGGDSTKLAVAFLPSVPGRSDASLVLTHNDADAGSQTTITLHANVYERIPGDVIAWGANRSGVAEIPNDLTDVIAIESGLEHSLALKLDGTVVGWGGGASAEIPVGLTDVVAIAGGFFSSLALKADGTVVAWGNNGLGETDVPVDLINPVAIAGGMLHSLALRSDGTVVGWGVAAYADVPANLTDVIAISSFFTHSLALKSDGTVVAWGDSVSGQTVVPVDLTDVIAVSAGYEHSLALKSDGTVVAWGENSSGQTDVPVDLTNVISVGGGDGHSLALKSDGTVVAWGSNFNGETDVPADLTDAVAIAAGYDHNLALRAAWAAVGDTVVSYGNVNVGNSVRRSLKITNKGSFPLVVSAVSVVGPDSASFSATPTAFSVAGRDSFDLSVTFAPSSTGMKSAALSIAHNAKGSPSLVALTGTGGQSSIELSTAALSLGSVPLGSSSTEYITVRNTGAGQLSVSSIGVLDGDFALFKVTPAVLPNVSAGDSAYVRVDFTPVTTGDFSTTLTLTHNASGSPSAIILSGKGTKPAIDISSGLVSLGPVPIGSSAFDSLKVKNRGSAQLVVSGIGVSGGDADLFTVTPSTLILAAGDSAYLRIAFTPVTVRETIVGVDPGPVALGDFSTTLSLTHNAGGLVNVSLSGLSWTTWRLFNARPNPFNVSVSMAYEIPVQTHVTLTVYNTLGQEVVRIVDQVLIPGRYEAVWDGINARGIRVSAGIYLYRIKCASGYTATKKMVFLK
jgi:alpha-tubulin suppressor-like RCC1 family protein